ncbi:MAG: DNA-directed RNA polymerase subunit beta, partial [Pseudomonadota bacterium]
MALSFTEKKRIRKSFGKIPEAIDMPNLIEVQRSSYEHFLQMKTPQAERTDDGLGGVFKSVFPIVDFNERASLEYVSYEFEPPKFDTEECMQRDLTYAAPLKVRLQLVVFDIDEETGAKSVKEVKEQEVYLGDIPLMTDKGTFIVNGTERVIVSQMHRSPGVFFDHDKGKTHSSGKLLFAARIIPYRGSWLDFEFDAKDVLNVRIDRKRKLPATTLMMALGYDSDQILDMFYTRSVYRLDKKGWITGFNPVAWKGTKPDFDLVDAKTGKVIAPAGRKVTALAAKRIAEGGT